MQNKFNKILIVGNGGSGKTTLSNKISKMLNIPILHLDNIYWINGWVHNEMEKFDSITSQFMQSQSWIIEGTPMRGFETRVSHSDTIIFLDFSCAACTFRIMKRSIKNIFSTATRHIDGPAKFFSLKALVWIWKFNNEKRKMILSVIARSNAKNLFHITTDRDLKKMLLTISNQ